MQRKKPKRHLLSETTKKANTVACWGAAFSRQLPFFWDICLQYLCVCSTSLLDSADTGDFGLRWESLCGFAVPTEPCTPWVRLCGYHRYQWLARTRVVAAGMGNVHLTCWSPFLLTFLIYWSVDQVKVLCVSVRLWLQWQRDVFLSA